MSKRNTLLYFTVLTPRDVFHFPNLKELLEGMGLGSNNEVTAASAAYFANLYKLYFLEVEGVEGLATVPTRDTHFSFQI